MKTLVIEKDEGKFEFIKLAFQVGWPDSDIVRAQECDACLNIVEKQYPDIVIIDASGYRHDYLKLLNDIRLFSPVPIVIVDELHDELKIVKALESGADEYLIHPIGQLELLARTRALLRRQKPVKYELPYSYGPLCLYPSSGRLTHNKKSMYLTRNECLIMLHLIKNGENIVSYSNLANTLWGGEYPGSIESIRAHIKNIKRKVESRFGLQNMVKNRVGLGYCLAKY